MTDALFPVEDARHPMWEAPRPSEALTAHVRALRKEIARQLTRFDGRQDMDVPVAFCQTAYETTLMPQAQRSQSWLIGEIVIRGAMWTQRLHRTKKEANKAERSADQRDSNIINGLVKQFTEAITKEVLS